MNRLTGIVTVALLASVATAGRADAQRAFPGPASGADIRFDATEPAALPARVVTSGPLQASTKGQTWWYRVDVLRSQAYVVRTVTPNVDTVLELFGPAVPTTRIARDDDGGGGRASRIRAELEAGRYWIEVSNVGTYMGNFTLEIAEAAKPAPIAAAKRTQNVDGATTRAQREAWYRLFADTAGRYEIRTTSHSFDTVLDLYRAGQPTALAHNDDSTAKKGSAIEHDLTPGEYWIKVSGYGNRSGTFALQIVAPAKPPAETPPGRETGAMRLTADFPPGPADVLKRLADAIDTGSFDTLKGLCDPTGSSDGFARRMCSVSDRRDDQPEFIGFFSGGDIHSILAVNDNTLAGTYADIVVAYKAATVTLRTVQQQGAWYLHSLRDVKVTK